MGRHGEVYDIKIKTSAGSRTIRAEAPTKLLDGNRILLLGMPQLHSEDIQDQEEEVAREELRLYPSQLLEIKVAPPDEK